MNNSTFTIFNHVTGVSFELDRQRSRVRRLQRRVAAWCDALKEHFSFYWADFRLVMFTLTYTRAEDWRPNHIREFRIALRKAAGVGLVAYAWCAELQRRGAVHYHFLALVKRGTNLPMPDKSGIWPYGSTRTETARSPYYILKYAGKEHQKIGEFPKGMRMFAVWVCDELLARIDLGCRAVFALSVYPVWLRDLLGVLFNDSRVIVRARRLFGGGWCDDWGTAHFSPWSIVSPALEAGDKQKFLAGLSAGLQRLSTSLQARRRGQARTNAFWRETVRLAGVYA